MKSNIFRYAGAALVAAGITLAQTAPSGTDNSNNPPARSHSGKRAMARNHFGKLAEQLNLTDAQKEQAKTIFQEARQQAQPIRQQLRENREALAAAVKAGKGDAEIQQLSATTGSLMGQLTAIRTEAFAKVYATLTPEQRTKADQLHEQMKTRFQQRQHNRKSNNG
jgi:Spy/CpxP family protein refolding chaperone